jgi:hypothetical protein
MIPSASTNDGGARIDDVTSARHARNCGNVPGAGASGVMRRRNNDKPGELRSRQIGPGDARQARDFMTVSRGYNGCTRVPLMLHRRRAVALLAPMIAVAAGCADSPGTNGPPGPGCTSGKCDGWSSYDPIDAPELVRCWIVPNQPSAHVTQDGQPVMVDQLVCQRNQSSSPVTSKGVRVDLTGSMAPQGAMLAAPIGQSEVALEIAPQWAPYPLDLKLTAFLDSSEPTLSDELGLSAVAKDFALTGPMDATPDAPFVVDHAFTLWPVTMTCAMTACIVTTSDYSVALTNVTAVDLNSGATASNLTIHGVALDQLANGQSAKLHVVAPSGGASLAIPATAILIDGASQSAPSTSFTIDGPGEYVASATGVAKQPH